MTEVEWWNLRAPQLRSLQDEDALVIVPVGSTEQHGPHLPVMVDALLAGEIARRTARRLAGERAVVVAPTVWSGLAEHHMSLGGTITLDYQTFFALLRCIASSMARHGFRRILLLNGHGGNINALNVIVGELTGELQIPIVGCTYALLAGEIARRTARRLAGERAVVVAPTVWSGLAEHHMSLGGTITLDYQTFFALLRCIASSMARHGFRRRRRGIRQHSRAPAQRRPRGGSRDLDGAGVEAGVGGHGAARRGKRGHAARGAARCRRLLLALDGGDDQDRRHRRREQRIGGKRREALECRNRGDRKAGHGSELEGGPALRAVVSRIGPCIEPCPAVRERRTLGSRIPGRAGPGDRDIERLFGRMEG